MEATKKAVIIAPFVYTDSTEEFLANGLREVGWEVVCQKTQYLREAPDGDTALTLVVKQCPFPAEQLPGKKVLYLLDNLTRKPELAFEACKAYDHVMLAHHDKIEDEDSRFYFLPVGYDPRTHFWAGFNPPKTTDVCFIGTCHPSREWIKRIPGIEIYGNSWDAVRYPIYNIEKREQVYHTKINVNQHFPHDTVNMRQFEIAAMCGFLLSDQAWPFEESVEVAFYRNEQDFKAQVAYYLEDEDEREVITKNGYEAVRKHSYAERMREMLSVIGCK